MSDPISLTGVNIQLRLQTPYDLVLTAGVDKEFTPQSLGLVMDLLTGVAEREQLKGEIMSLKTAMRRNKEILEKGDFERSIAKFRADRAEMDKQISADWVRRSRRGAVELSGSQKQALSEFDKQIKTAEHGLRDLKTGLIVSQYQLDCMYARLAGESEPEMPDNVRAALAVIELPDPQDFPSAQAA